MFDKKETKNIYVDKDAAKVIAKSNVKSAKEAAKIQADAEDRVAYHERMARREAEEMRLARENPEAYRMMKEFKKQEDLKKIVIVLCVFVLPVIIMFIMYLLDLYS